MNRTASIDSSMVDGSGAAFLIAAETEFQKAQRPVSTLGSSDTASAAAGTFSQRSSSGGVLTEVRTLGNL